MSGWLPAEPSSPAGMLAIALLVAFVAVNLWTIWLVYSDKRRARNDERRIPERTLLGWAAAGGLIGLFIGMRAFRHKTKKVSFQLKVGAVTALYLGAFVLGGYAWSRWVGG